MENRQADRWRYKLKTNHRQITWPELETFITGLIHKVSIYCPGTGKPGTRAEENPILKPDLTIKMEHILKIQFLV